MKGLAITSKGIEDISAIEINDLLNTETKIHESCVSFDINKLEDLCLLSYKTQSNDKILLLLDSIKLNDKFLDNISTHVKKLQLKPWLSNLKYSFDCIRSGSHEFSSVDVESILRKDLSEEFQKSFNCEFNLSKPDITLIIYIRNNDCYIGIDFSGLDLHKRHYKIFSHSASLRATIAYSLVRLSDFNKGKTILDPFIGDGVIAIESALFSSKFPLRYYSKDKFAFLKFNQFKDFDFDKFFSKIDSKSNLKSDTKIYGYGYQFKNVDKSKKNAKIAGILETINFSRVEIEWLDVKFKKESIDCIVTKLPITKSDPTKLLNNFFDQSHFVLKNKGKISLVTYTKDPIINSMKNHKFILLEERIVQSGKQPLHILILQKQ